LNWGNWSPVGECSKTCGEGTITYKGTCRQRNRCPGNGEKTLKCNKGPCVAEDPAPEWSDWQDGGCSVTCGGAGTRTYSRTCPETGMCDGAATRTEDCNNGACPTCSRPDVPYLGSAVCKGPDGAVLGDNEPHPLGSVCTYSCSDGAMPSPHTTLTCTSDGMPNADWDKDAPCCKLAQCDITEFMDLVIIVDKSRSNERKGWSANIEMMHTVLGSGLNIGPDNVRVAILPFAREVDKSLEINLKDTTNQEDLLNAILAMNDTELESYTFTPSVMRYAADNALTPANGDRDLAPNLIVLITDGKPTEGIEDGKYRGIKTPAEIDQIALDILEPQAKYLRTKGAVFAVGIGLRSAPGRRVMNTIAGSAYPQNVFIVGSPDELLESLDDISTAAVSAGCDACIAPPQE